MKDKLDGISSSVNPMKQIWENIWKLKIPTKIKTFCWKALNNIIRNKVNLHSRGIDTPIICPICNQSNENSDHCLFVCKRAQEIWKLTFDCVFLEEEFNGSLVDIWIRIKSRHSRENLELIAITCWAIWLDRNKSIHGETTPTVQFRSQWILDLPGKLSSIKLEGSCEEDDQRRFFERI